eukprot:CAMPEP_0194379140 /NCGR_PEP_ID=MMETSP0174-20130528/38139_1 /TAXON_ID=216777 /ORGANISM="Proboscia alata, Strain PI-D3" /LENGTH=251 /DNA_ID=CAMNT_0039161627 /DNA_START=218 /DNA_END=973 /DNA_ORIENTATION=-
MSPLPDKTLAGIPCDSQTEAYWYNPSIHSFGNVGLLGGFHAAFAPIATKIIDSSAYDGINVRDELSKELRNMVGNENAKICDLCCGVGMSTRALQAAFPQSDTIVGIDTSPQMLGMAEAICETQENWNLLWNEGSVPNRATYLNCNAENTGLPLESFDLVTAMYGFHEIPYYGRSNILREARRILSPGGIFSIIDISPKYEPSTTMLSGEPYVLEYKKNIEKQLKNVGGFHNLVHREVVPGHLSMFTMSRR